MATHRTYAEFWPFYLGEHSKPQTRGFHYVGSIASVVLLIWAVATQSWWWLLAVPTVGTAITVVILAAILTALFTIARHLPDKRQPTAPQPT